ncbi:MAG TPA: RNase adapter RapZ [bacterium]|nr:RNase adapter RapZ [bacterium]HPN43244.1 RNase adapter RapZ [bacterium]
MAENMTSKLQITIYSFGFHKSGPPPDINGNGGGFVFDCRALPNPHYVPELKNFTGQDRQITDYLAQYPVVQQFIVLAASLVQLTAENFNAREFTHLYVAFGCTGGKHRSVYCAETLAAMLKDQYQITLEHRDLPGKQEI